METLADYEIIVVGYNSVMCCLSTIIDGYHRGFKITYAKDGSLAKASSSYDEAALHAVMCEVLGTFAKVQSTEDILKSW